MIASQPDWLIPLLGGNTLLSAALGYLVPAMVTRRKDAGDLASDLLRQALERIDKLERENAACAEKAARLEQRCDRNELVLRLTLSDLGARAPDSPALRQARTLCGATFAAEA
ncbi:hypothetical protein [Rhizorhabdus sp.]|jgi:hypothetical protein|uniref:hypothetical protein n=1 Tax=Rhizorhabdus sp. TaxID=1968843 RepID=UPI0035B1255A